MRSSRLRYGDVEVRVDTYVDVDLGEILEDVEDEIILKECRRRGIPVWSGSEDAAEEMREAAEAITRAAAVRDLMEVEVQLRQMLELAGVPRLKIAPRGGEAPAAQVLS